MKKILMWLFAKLVCRKVKVKINSNGDFSYDYVKEIVHLSTKNADDLGFYRHIYEKHNPLISLPLSVWSILHEIGHYHTLDEVEDTTKVMAIKSLCATLDKDRVRGLPLIENMYFDCEDEWLATEWACDYVARHPRFCKFFGKLLK